MVIEIVIMIVIVIIILLLTFLEFLVALGHDVEIRVRRTRKAQGHVSVVVAA